MTVSLSTVTHFQFNGGAPPLPATPPLVGDRLFMITPAEANIYSDQAIPPNVSISSSILGTPTEPATHNNFELLFVVPLNETVNILGDNGNNPGTDQDDRFLINGQDVDSLFVPGDADGVNEFSLLINGSAPIFFANTRFLNVSAFEGNDDTTIDPYADNTLGGWDIATNVNGGAGDDNLTYGNIDRSTAAATGQPGIVLLDNSTVANPYRADGGRSGVAEAVVVAPTSVAGAGRIRSTIATNNTNISTIDFVETELKASPERQSPAGDVDTLTVLGTAGADNFVVDFTEGDEIIPTVDDDPWIDLVNAGLQIERFARITVMPIRIQRYRRSQRWVCRWVTVMTSCRSPVAAISPICSPTTINVDSGNPSASDTIDFTGTANADDLYSITAGAQNLWAPSWRRSIIRRPRPSTTPTRKACGSTRGLALVKTVSP